MIGKLRLHFSSFDNEPVRLGSTCSTDIGELSTRKDAILSYLWIDFANNTPPLSGGVDSSDWQFGPSFSTNKIVFTARAVSLV